jgi:hypothetical protein
MGRKEEEEEEKSRNAWTWTVIQLWRSLPNFQRRREEKERKKRDYPKFFSFTTNWFLS